MGQRFSVAVLAMFLTASAFSAGKTSFPFLELDPNARSAALAGAASGYVGDPLNVFSNPAGAAHTRQTSMNISHVGHVADSSYDVATVLFPTAKGGWGLSMSYFRVQDIPRTVTVDSSVNADRFVSDGEVKASDAAFWLTWARRRGKHWAFGANVKAVQETLHTENAQALLADAGFVYRFPFKRDWRAAGSIQDVGLATSLADKAPLPPTRARGGVLWNAETWARFSLEGVLPAEGDAEAMLGGEFTYQDIGFLRAGYRHRFRDADLGTSSGFTLGLGFLWRALQFDYAYVPYGDLGDSHRLSLTWRLPKKKKS